MARSTTLAFLRTESGAGLVLALAALAAVVLANSPLAPDYFSFIEFAVPIRVGEFDETRSVLEWTRDGLMAMFFLILGMEIKFEVLRGEFSSPRRLVLPLVAAVGGMAVPALVYLAVNRGPSGQPAGWPIPTPTDVAFSLGALATFGRRLPQSLRLFLLTLAVADDVGALVLVGVLFSTPLHATASAAAVLTLGVLAAMSRWRQAPWALYVAGFVLVWAFTLQSGVNTSLAGLGCALTVPIAARRPGQIGMLKTFMDGLHPYVAYVILPFFAFVSAGFSLGDMGWRAFFAPWSLGVIVGLFVAKPIGILGFSALAVALRLGRRPMGATWLELWGVALLCGAGFTMSFFLGAQALPAADVTARERLPAAVIMGSLMSVLAGGGVMLFARARRQAER